MTFSSIFPLVPLGDVTDFINGDRSSNYPKGEDYVDVGIPFVSATDLENGRVDRRKARQISSASYERLRGGKIRSSDVLFCLRGSLGKMALVHGNEPGAIASSLVVLRSKSNIDSRYLYYTLSSDDGQQIVGGLNNGAAQPNLSVAQLTRVEIPLPQLVIQHRIAGILSAYDELIENSHRRIKILESTARALYREWFVYFRYPGHESVPLAPSVLGGIPKGWEVTTIRGVADLVSRGPSLKYIESGGVQVVNQRCIRDEEIEMQAVQFAAPLSAKKSHLYLQPRDVLINSMGVGTLGRVSRNLTIDEPTIIHNCITVVRSKSNEPTQSFLFYRLSECQEQFESLGIGATGQTSLRIETILDVQVALPSLALLSAFENLVSPIWAQIGVLKHQIKNLRATRDLLLPRLLSGQIDVEAMAS